MRLYVTGGTGLVGSHVIDAARKKFDAEIIASLYGPPPDGEVDYELDPLDLSDHEAARKSIHKYKPDVVIHCAALLDQVWMYQNRAAAWHIMVGGTRALAEACRDVDARFVFVSTDWVFDGMMPLIDEETPPFPVNFYGIMKMASERELSTMQDLNFGIGRLAGVFGENIAIRDLTRRGQGLGFDHGNYVVKRLMAGQVADVWAGPKVNDVAHATLASDGAEMLLRVAKHEENGIFHCWGSEAVTRLDFAIALAEAFGFDPGRVKPVPTDPDVLAEHVNIRVPFRIRANSDKTTQALGRQTMNLKDAVRKFKEEWDELNG